MAEVIGFAIVSALTTTAEATALGGAFTGLVGAAVITGAPCGFSLPETHSHERGQRVPLFQRRRSDDGRPWRGSRWDE